MKRGLAKIRVLSAFSRAGQKHHGHLLVGGLTLPCVLGPAGIKAIKREGDGATPRGNFKLLRGLWRQDRLPRPQTRFSSWVPITRTQGWCDALHHRAYNCPIRLPFQASHEALWRDDAAYDVVVILDYNQNPRRQNGGSAIFFHFASKGNMATSGCVALDPRSMARLLPRLSRNCTLQIGL